MLGTYDAVPSDDQLRQLFTAPGEHGRVRARVRLKADGNSDINLILPDKKKERKPGKGRVA